MQAMVHTRDGPPDVLQFKEVAKPVPRDDEVLIKVQATSVKRSDWESLIDRPLYARFGGLFRPGRQILGSDIAGNVEAVGSRHRHFQPREEVFGDILGRLGGFAEYVCVRGGTLALKPAKLTFEEAAAIPQAAVIALQGMRDKGQVQPGQKVLINGAGGGAGTMAVQLAKREGAVVSAVDRTKKLAMLRSIGADYVIDFKHEDFTRSGQAYDVIIDVVGKSSFSRSLRALKPNGRCLLVTPGLAHRIRARWTQASDKQVIIGTGRQTAKDLAFLKDLIEAGQLKPVIDRECPLDQMAEAHRYVDQGHKKGNVAVTVAH